MTKRQEFNRCADMASNNTLSIIASELADEYGLLPHTVFSHLVMLNALACNNRYGADIGRRVYNAGKYTDNHGGELQTAVFVINFLDILDTYLSRDNDYGKEFLKCYKLNKDSVTNAFIAWDKLQKLANKYNRAGLGKKHREFFYLTQFVYHYDDPYIYDKDKIEAAVMMK